MLKSTKYILSRSYTKNKMVCGVFLPNINAFVETRFIASYAAFGRWECQTR